MKAKHKGPRLLVPIILDALLVDESLLRLERNDWARNPIDYAQTINLGPAFPRNIATERSTPNNQKVKTPDKGAHLQWILPDGLCRGVQEGDASDLKFPQAPNRWAIIRVWYDRSQRLQLKAWVIKSDHLRTTSPTYQGPQYLLETNEKVELYQIGDFIKLEEWDGDIEETEGGTPALRAKLSAVGHDNPTFNSYTVNNQNVFSFHDNLSDVVYGDLEEKGVNLSYLTAGWYSAPEEDPLFQEKYQASDLLKRMEDLEFSIGGKAGLEQAVRQFETWSKNDFSTHSPLMLCHGAVHSIQWYGPDNNDQNKSKARSGKPERKELDQQTNPDIIIANNSMDALVAFIETKLQEAGLEKDQAFFASDLLYAFKENLLEDYVQPKGESLLDNHIHRANFNSEPGGYYWEIVHNKTPGGKAKRQKLERTLNEKLQAFYPINELPSLAAIEADQKINLLRQTVLPELKKLNQAQYDLDKQDELLEARRRELYTSLFAAKFSSKRLFKPQKAEAWEQTAGQVNAQVQEISRQISILSRRIRSLVETIKQKLEVDANAPEDDKLFKLKKRLQSSYWTPNDPVALIHAAKTADKYGFHEQLHCRYSGQIIDGLSLRENQAPISLAIPQLPNEDKLPKEIPGLIKELVLLNPNFSSFFSPDSETAETIQKQQTMIWNTEKFAGFDPDQLMKEAGFDGKRPAFKAFRTFIQPWSPLFMDWVVYFFPPGGKIKVKEMQAKRALADWELTDDAFDYSWKADNPVPKIDQDVHKISWTIKGRSLITSQTPKILKRQLEMIRQDTLNELEVKTLDTIVSLLDGFDIITQKLNGFNDFLLRYDTANQIPVSLLKTENIDVGVLKDSQFGLPDSRFEFEVFDRFAPYYPIRSGFLLTHFVRIVDDFGIGFYPVGNDRPAGSDNLLIPHDRQVIPKGRGLDNEQISATGLAQLPPRILQPTRMTMEWIDAEDAANRPVSQADQNSPVCGWILPNHLDKSLMIFDALGKFQGALIFFKRGEEFLVKKALDPVSANPNGFQLNNLHLRDFVEGLLSYVSDKGAALSAFLEEIDLTTWITDPLGARKKRGLSAFIGRPLALVRARVSLEMKGFPIRFFDFQEPQEYDPQTDSDPFGIKQVDFPFYVGADNLPNNGLIGYFEESNYKNFQAISKKSLIKTPYVQERRLLKTRLNDAATPAEHKHYRYLTLIMDYRGKAHSLSGLTPVFELNLPARFTDEALTNMEVTFRTGPLITDPQQLRMPKPSDIQGKLSWIYQAGVQIWQTDKAYRDRADAWENPDIEEAGQDAGFPNKRNRLAEGWLKLADALGKI